MIPLRDENPRRTAPVVNVILIIINVLMFLWEVSLGPNLERALFQVAFIPARFWQGYIGPEVIRIFVSMFLHGGLLHLGGNMLYLWIFGDNIEDRLGHFKYLLFYLACGFAATFAHAFVNPSSGLPSIGASGAIAGVLGAYLILFPHARVLTIIPIVFFITVREVPAILVLGLWFVIQFFTGVGSLGAVGAESGGVAYFAHIGGFVSGIVLILLLGGKRRPPQRPVIYDGWR
ncbi:MAG TPA: rhomboid family intramembrane serine protease [Thermoanaerobaculia bacterium]|nr:rhomboid family intramembrane serine protease [Thermoanaerobaculia bacterium]